MTKLVTNNYKLNLITELLNSVEANNLNNFYMYVGDHVDRANSDIPTPIDDTQTVLNNAFRNMIFGKKITQNDVKILIRNIAYETNKVYTMYDHDDPDLLDSDFYCITNEGAYYHVYKCLDNNFDALSTIKPLIEYTVGTQNQIFTTSDGYVWKYMFSVDETTYDKFASENYFPVVANTTVEASAIQGAIEVIKIEGAGEGYGNYLTGTFISSDLRVNGNTFLYKISNSEFLDTTAGFYTGCLLYISGGIGAGQYRQIVDNFSLANGTYVVVNSAFSTAPQNNSDYEVTPDVIITGFGEGLEPAKARALVNSLASNSIWKIEMLDVGKFYEYATAEVVANSVVLVDATAELKPVYGPLYGHGANSSAELGAKSICFSQKFSNTEGNTITISNQYQSIGIVHDVKFDDVIVELDNHVGEFIENEELVVIEPLRFCTNAIINTSSQEIKSELSTLTGVTVTTGGTSGSYVPLETLTINNDIVGNAAIQATLTIVGTSVRTATPNASAIGTGYTNGDVVSLTTGVGNAATFVVTTGAANTSVASLVVNNAGYYYLTNPTLVASPTTNTTGAGTGLAIDLTMEVANVVIANTGAYLTIPDYYANNMPSGGSGTGVMVALTFETAEFSDFINQVSANDYILLSNRELTSYQLAVVNVVTNSSFMTITTNGGFACSQCFIYDPRVKASMIVYDVPNTSHVNLTDVNYNLQTGTKILGVQSGSYATVNTISRSGEQKWFDTYMQLYRYSDLSYVSGVFTPNEQVYQGDTFETALATATLHSTPTVNSVLYAFCSNQVGTFTPLEQLKGVVSGAVANINITYKPELKFGSGTVLYIENIESVTRDTTQTEQFKIIFDL